MSEHRTRYVYFAHDGAPADRVKIGISIAPRFRLKELRCELLFAVPCEYRFAWTLEQELHKEFADIRLNYERNCREGWTEWFAVDDRLSRLIEHVRRTGLWPFDRTPVVL